MHPKENTAASLPGMIDKALLLYLSEHRPGPRHVIIRRRLFYLLFFISLLFHRFVCYHSIDICHNQLKCRLVLVASDSRYLQVLYTIDNLTTRRLEFLLLLTLTQVTTL